MRPQLDDNPFDLISVVNIRRSLQVKLQFGGSFRILLGFNIDSAQVTMRLTDIVGGAILASKRSPYDDLVAAGYNAQVLAERLQRQHKLICAAINAGRIEDLKRLQQRATAPQAEAGAMASLLGTTTRTDGKVEVTYAGHPLYYFIQDKKAGDTTGQGVNGFGALWWVLSPSGAAITTK